MKRRNPAPGDHSAVQLPRIFAPPRARDPRRSEEVDCAQGGNARPGFAGYLEARGFPEAQGLTPPERRQLLQGYVDVDVLLLRDVIERHGVGNVTALRWMVRRLLGNPGGLFSITKFEADLKSQGIPAGRESLYEMLAHLEDAFLLVAIPVATDSEKRRQLIRAVYHRLELKEIRVCQPPSRF